MFSWKASDMFEQLRGNFIMVLLQGGNFFALSHKPFVMEKEVCVA